MLKLKFHHGLYEQDWSLRELIAISHEGEIWIERRIGWYFMFQGELIQAI